MLENQLEIMIPEEAVFTDKAIDTIRTLTTSTSAILIGYVTYSTSTVTVLSALRHPSTALVNDAALFSLIDAHLPGGLGVVGIAETTDDVTDDGEDSALIRRFSKDCQPIRALWTHVEDGLADVTILNNQAPVKYTVLPRADVIRGTLSVQFSVKHRVTESEIKSTFDNLITDSSNHVKVAGVLLQINGDQVHTSGSLDSSSTTVGDLWLSTNDDDVKTAKKMMGELRFDKTHIDGQFFKRVTGDALAKSIENCAPVVKIDKYTKPIKTTTATLNVMAIVPLSASLQQLRDALHCGLRRAAQIASNQKSSFTTCAFHPPSLGHFIMSTLLSTEDERRVLHSAFDLPMTRPQLRPCNIWHFGDTIASMYLYNVHESCKLESAHGGKLSLVSGNYTYHHYMQDGVNDNGWGCAYRSLQTICSWMTLNGFTVQPVPTHEQIQQALVDVGDREKSFVGSRQWIGSLELSYIIDHLLKMECRIVTAANGGEMPTKARELQAHFDAGGAPVMIGGGVLAHTILGVDYNDQTGDVRWMVLDPHYTGEENIKTIVQKGWCNWKPVSFWQPDAFYNMLLPQTPKCI